MISKRAVAVLALFTSVACAGRRHDQVAVGERCAPTVDPLAASADVRQLTGDYLVTFVSTAGTREGNRIDGRLTLRQQADSMVPAVGSLELSLDSIGAVPMGDAASTAPGAPGVGIYAGRGNDGGLTSLVARVGSASNMRGGPAAMDGGHFTLYLRRVTSKGVSGGWSSSNGIGMGATRSDGYFCASKH